MSNLISCHKYFFKKKKRLKKYASSNSVQTLPTPALRDSGKQHHSPHAQRQKVRGIPAVLFVFSVMESHSPWGFSWVVEVELWVAAQCVCAAGRGGMFTKGWLQSSLIEEVSVPMSTPAPENRHLVSGGNLGWIALRVTASPSPLHFDQVALAHLRFLLLPALEGTMQCEPVGWHLGCSGLCKWVKLPPRLKQWAQGISLFRVLHPVTPSHLAFLLEAASELKLRGYENTHRRERWRKGRCCSSGIQKHNFLWFLVLAFFYFFTRPSAPRKISSCSLWFSLIGSERRVNFGEEVNLLRSSHRVLLFFWLMAFLWGKTGTEIGCFYHEFLRWISQVSCNTTQEDPVFTIKLGFIHVTLLQSLFWLFKLAGIKLIT